MNTQYELSTSKQIKIFIKDFFSKCDHTFTEGIFNGKLHFLCSVQCHGYNLKQVIIGHLSHIH